MNYKQIREAIPIYDEIQALEVEISRLKSIQASKVHKIIIECEGKAGVEFDGLTKAESKAHLKHLLKYKEDQSNSLKKSLQSL